MTEATKALRTTLQELEAEVGAAAEFVLCSFSASLTPPPPFL